ncbi:MAG: peptidoglycan editing factor PgeF [Holosporales bacterium]|jgi:YfiH family protein|nr:peptidoglycan editing factor PgeF [Holosporales bacterium]
MNVTKSDTLSEIEFIDHGFFDRTGGNSVGNFESLNVGFGKGDDNQAVLQNREKIAQHFGLTLSDIVILQQVHGDNVHIIDSKNKKDYTFVDTKQDTVNEGDAIITNEKGVLIGVTTADCAPVLVCDKTQKYIAVIHAGWKGAVGAIIENTISKMKSFGCRNMVAAIGPCVQKRYFEIKFDVAKYINSKYIYRNESKILFDMPLLIVDKLMTAGVKVVSKISIDTTSNDNYFSCRRQGDSYGVQFSGLMIRK